MASSMIAADDQTVYNYNQVKMLTDLIVDLQSRVKQFNFQILDLQTQLSEKKSLVSGCAVQNGQLMMPNPGP